jgi:hypothetical protein
MAPHKGLEEICKMIKLAIGLLFEAAAIGFFVWATQFIAELIVGVA